jgi:phage-related protein
MLEVRFFETDAGNSQPRDFLDALPQKDRAYIVGDIAALRDYGIRAPISTRRIKGGNNRGMSEIRTGNFRTFYCFKRGAIWILHVCKKQDQLAGIEAARQRMQQL